MRAFAAFVHLCILSVGVNCPPSLVKFVGVSYTGQSAFTVCPIMGATHELSELSFFCFAIQNQISFQCLYSANLPCHYLPAVTTPIHHPKLPWLAIRDAAYEP